MSKYLKKIGLAVVSLGHHNKIYYRLCGLNGRHLFLTVLETGKSQIKVWAGSVPGWLEDSHLVTVISCGLSSVHVHERKRLLVCFPLLVRIPVELHQGSTNMTS